MQMTGMIKLFIEKKEPYYIQFYRMIRQMIFDGKFQPGEHINETQLAKEYNVSKSPIREAVRILEKEGLLVADKSKMLVYKPTITDVEEIYYCRMALESFAVNLTTKLVTDDELSKIEAILAETEAAINKKMEANSIIFLNEQFHQLILTYTKNNRLQKQVYDLKGLINYYRILNFQGNERAVEILEQHRRIFYYMKERDETNASAEMVNHLERDLKHLLQIMMDSTRNL